MARNREPYRNDEPLTPAMARVIVHQTFPFKLANGSVLMLEPAPDYQVVKREIADALVASGRGALHETDLKSNAASKSDNIDCFE